MGGGIGGGGIGRGARGGAETGGERGTERDAESGADATKGFAVVPLAERLVWELSVIARSEGRSPAVDALLGHLARHLPTAD